MKFKLVAVLFICCVFVNAQTNKNFAKNNLSFDYPNDWELIDDTNDDAQQFTLTKTNSDVQIRGFIHKGKISGDKLPEAKSKFIDPYIAATAKQFVQMGAKPEQSPDTTEIGGIKADGVKISASLGGETGAAKIYWALVGQRVVVLTLFGPDTQLKKFAPAWDLVRTSLKIGDSSAVPKPSP
jgi:hypothetical protein